MDIKNIKNPLFKVQTVSDWIEFSKERPMPKYLFSEFWLEGEVAILFADTGRGKSILAVQIAESLARGEQIAPFKNTAPPQQVLYLDFELTSKQFEMRYTEDREESDDGEDLDAQPVNHYQFSTNFSRAEAKTLDDHPRSMYKTFDEYLIDNMVKLIRDTGAKVLIVDNLTYLRQQNERACEAVRLMRALKEIRDEFAMSILVLAHTPKRAVTSPLTVNDLQGSKILSNFADNIFAIGSSTAESDVRYLKHIKLRSSEMHYDTLNVPVFRLKKRNGNFLSFNFMKIEDERLLLGGRPGTYDPHLMEQIRDGAAHAMTQRAIAGFLGISKNTVTRYLRLGGRARVDGMQNVECKMQNFEAVGQAERMHNAESRTQNFEDESETDDDCDCHECLSGNPDQCLETDWTQECCDGTDPSCCGTTDSGQWTTENGERTNDGSDDSVTDNRRPTTDNPQPTTDHRPLATDPEPVISKIFHGPKRRRLQDLEKQFNDLGHEMFVEEMNEQTGKPRIWYNVDNLGYVHRWVRDDGGCTGKRLGKAPFIE